MVKQATINRYIAQRPLRVALNNAIVNRSQGDSMKLAAESLGLWEDGKICLPTEDAIVVLADHALHSCIAGGMNLVDRYIQEHPPQAGSVEEQVLLAKQAARFTLLGIQSTVPGKYLRGVDLLTDEERTVIDINLSRSCACDMLLACRLMPFEEYWITTGAALPVMDEGWEEIEQHWLEPLRKADGAGTWARMETQRLVGEVLATCLRTGSCEAIFYVAPPDKPARRKHRRRP